MVRITHQGKNPEEALAIPWYLHVENKCDHCETTWVIEADDPKYHIILGAITVALNNRSMERAEQGWYHVNPPSEASPYATVWSWCPTCGRRACTKALEDDSVERAD